MEHKEGNILINKFMEKEITPVVYSALIFQHQGYYHKDWNWLMPVVIKINQLDITDMDDNCGLLKMDVENSLYGIGNHTDMGTVWEAVINFLKSYLK